MHYLSALFRPKQTLQNSLDIEHGASGIVLTIYH